MTDATHGREAAERFRDFAELGSQWYWEWDADFRYTYLSERGIILFGIPLERVVGRHRDDVARERYSEFHADQLERHLDDLAQRRPFRDYRFVARRRTGGVIHVATSGKPIFAADGTFRGYRGVSEDITERIAAETRLQQSEERFRDFAAASADRFWETDEEHRLTYVSPPPEGSGRPNAAKLVGQYRWGVPGNLDQGQWTDYKIAIAAQLPVRGFRYAHRLGTGRVIWIQTSALPVYDADGTFRGYRGTNLDITAHVSIEERLRDALSAAELAESRLRTAIDTLEDGFALYDSEDRFVLCNSKYAEFYERSADMLVPGATFEDIVRTGAERGQLSDAVGRVEEWVAERMRYHRAANETYVQKLASGRWLRVTERKTPDGGTVGFRVDITDLMRREEELAAAREQADAANRAKTEFLSAMSHELRTPMNAILGFSQLIEGAADELTPEQIVDYAHQIVRSGQHLLGLINDVLELSKIESGHASLSIETVHAKPLVDECLDMLKGRAADAKVTLIDEIGGRELPPLSTDRNRFRQIVLNLLSNAVKYNRAGGTVVISAHTDVGEVVRFAIADSGDGIAPDEQPHLFEPFNRLGRETGEIEGTGIGLYLTKRLVEQLGGAIGFTSTAGIGSTFWVEFPISHAVVPDSPIETSTAVPVADRNSRAGRRFVILHVEDNPSNLRLMEEVFARLPHLELISARSAELGIALARERRPDLALMDIDLPGMNGFEALASLAADAETAAIPVIALTAVAAPNDISRGLAAGFAAYLTKPIDLAEVIGTIECRLGLR